MESKVTLEQDVLSDMDGFSPRPIIINEWKPVADILSEAFQWKGSKIDWDSLLRHAERSIKFDSMQVDFDVKEFIKDSGLYEFLSKKDKIYYINDSSLDFAVSLEPKIFLEFVVYVIHNIPQHHYFFEESAKWCLAITSEGYIDFGVRN